ncbi:hypothetical protein CLV51_103315 [Chitinophaga niastensis]|uniref:Uncharacterized protein n=1 Tax=Chitinophaga niastensis TaxID=536980 RepID=A0A2P8HJD5_CHINA|nr:hypothetical protein [Chitinophaga niastensis]PSL46337.1 hypothetical protein CLV51_103315 [Chitinophaga niastensis]
MEQRREKARSNHLQNRSVANNTHSAGIALPAVVAFRKSGNELPLDKGYLPAMDHSKQVLQPKWDPSRERGAAFEWDTLMDGVRWYADEAGNMWYKVIAPGRQDYREGEGDHKKWVEWHLARRSTHPEEYPVPAGFLGALNPKADLSGWNAGKESLINAHHKFPKSALAWLYEHMSEADQLLLKQRLSLPRSAGPAALARLTSNLISADYQKRKVSSDARLDDPHNNREQSSPGEEFLDLVHTIADDGAVTPRSAKMQSLAQEVVKPIYIHLKLQVLALKINEDDFVMTHGEAVEVIDKLRSAEELHYAIEPDPSKPSHSTGDVWDPSGGFHKIPVAPVHIGVAPHALAGNYEAAKREEQEQQRLHAQAEREAAQEQERAPHTGASAFMGHSERLGKATMGARAQPREGSYGWAVSHGREEYQRNLIAACYITIVDKEEFTPALIEKIMKAATLLKNDYEKMREAQFLAWQAGVRDAHLVGKAAYDNKVDELAQAVIKEG